MNNSINKYIAEIVGTFILVYAIASAATVYQNSGQLGVIAALVVCAIFGSSMTASVTLPANGNVVRAFVLETVMTFTLVYVVLATTTSKNYKLLLWQELQ